ncbi:hypothetical protein [Actinomyces procaprae]|uniref:hypothetical protein n=1 Tax=Actinomyces procaprae TaxID=2560010 RepID=UPI0010A23D96|nr:hypothetical protein [Actinomyces procaprae]
MHVTITVQADHTPAWRFDASAQTSADTEEDTIRESLQLAIDLADTIDQLRDGKAAHSTHLILRTNTTIDTRLLRIPDMRGLHLN